MGFEVTLVGVDPTPTQLVKETLMNNVWVLLGLIVVVGATVVFYLWSKFTSRKEADESNAALPMDGSQALAQVAQKKKV